MSSPVLTHVRVCPYLCTGHPSGSAFTSFLLGGELGEVEVQGVCFFLGCSRPAACLPAEDMAIQFLMVFYVNLRGLGLLQAKDFGLLGYSER